MFRPILVHAANPGPMTGSGNNTFLIVGSRGRATLVDAGLGDPEYVQAVGEQLRRHGATLYQVLVTHAHHDHVSGAPALRAAYPQARFRKRPWPGHDDEYGIAWEAIIAGEPVDLGDDTLQAVYTPGHSPDHVAFWHEPSRTAFVGDLLTSAGTVMIDVTRGGDLAQYLSSLEHIRALEPALLLPAHGDPIDRSGAVLTGIIEHRLAREGQVLRALAAGASTVQAIAESIYDGLDPALLPAAHATVRAHLEKLRREGRASAEAGRWAAR